MNEEARAALQAAQAAKDPTAYGLLTYLWVFGLAMLGGAVSFLRKMRSGAARPWNVVEFVGELATAAFTGVITFWMCEWAGFDPLLTAAFVGISGHMGSRALFMFEQMLANKFGVTSLRDKRGDE